MTTDSGDYLVSARGALEDALSGDVEEIVLRARSIGDGADGPAELAEAARTEADRYERLARDGWRLEAPFAAGQATVRRDDDADTGGEQMAPAGGAVAGVDPAQGLGGALDGAGTLAEATGRLRAAADTYARLADDGATFVEPVEDGRVQLADG